MDQQQSLRIVLGVIVVDIAAAIGINIFAESAAQANFDAVISDMLRIASNAQQWYMRPGSPGGGGRLVTVFTLPQIRVSGSNSYTLADVALVTEHR